MGETEQAEDWRAKVGERINQGLSVDLARAREPGRGRDANTPEQIPFRGWSDILWRVLSSVSAEDPIHFRRGGLLQPSSCFPRYCGSRFPVRAFCRRQQHRKALDASVRHLAGWRARLIRRSDHVHCGTGE
jgi:hypothetical protein